tara:strand:- start:496 stop:648 length:153 start_codon:yes stop_codon:yes gene_type:complete
MQHDLPQHRMRSWRSDDETVHFHVAFEMESQGYLTISMHERPVADVRASF